MILKKNDVAILNLAMLILELRTRFVRYGIMTVEEYRNARTSSDEQPLVYSTDTLDEDGRYTIFSGFGVTNRYYEDVYVRYVKGDTRSEDFLEVAVPVVFEADCQHCPDCNVNACKEIGYYQLYLIGRDGTIDEDIDGEVCDTEDEPETCGGCNGDCEHCHADAQTVAAMEECRTSGAHNFCNCECGEALCFVECGPDPEAECDFNENGRCHCPHNRCCGCGCECEPEEEE